ncbi:uncharacterized protein B0H18DRAFT_1021264 [Fomitopsis serialis]|uniref:uncharacterized protein n=1 Tax=Fomitopsis serialis TaxID=139415 RepID=UPI002007B51D|nr:uncharacterized protein B0H18DRAFT_1021264 [Neoantrodia serialis]KAH9921471.1 hypothetical protein B0H18DRAFT_1021264 [Neoantrodia serialis]
MPLPSHLQLPLELHEYIIDYLHDDQRALRACSLAYRGLLRTTRHHLFESIVLRRVADCLRFLDALESSAQTPVRIADYVRDIQLPYMALVRGNRGERKGWRFELLRRILRDLRNLACLRMHAFDWLGFFDLLTMETFAARSLTEAMAAFFPFPNLKKLHIDHCVLRSSRELTRLMSVFPRLSWLDLQLIVEPSIPGESSPEPSDDLRDLQCVELGTNMRTLVADFNYSSQAMLACIVESLLGPPFEVNLSRVVWDAGPLERRQVDDMSLLKEVIRRSEATLESFKATFPEDGESLPQLLISVTHLYVGMVAWLTDLDLSRHQQLTTFTLALRFDVENPFFSALPVFFSGLTSERLRDVHLHFELVDIAAEWAYVDWPRLDQAFASLHRRCPLLSITFHVHSIVVTGSERPHVFHPLKERLSQTIEAGMRVALVLTKTVFRPRDDSNEPLHMEFTTEIEERCWLS